LILPEKPPQTYDELRKVIEQTIANDLNQAQCGGWNTDVSVVSAMPTVTGVPGRYGVPLGNVTSGMASRIETGGRRGDGFEYPEGDDPSTGAKKAWGLATACDPDADQTTVEIADFDPSCGFFPPIYWTYPTPIDDPPCLDPNACNQFCDDINRDWVFDHCHVVCPPGAPAFCQIEPRYICTEMPIWSDQPNCKVCEGEKCRCEKNAWCEASRRRPTQIYQSFHRQYFGKYTRGKVPDVPQDQTEKEGVAACYAFYHEYDPKEKVTDSRDKRCVIDIETRDLRGTQLGKGEYGAKREGIEDPAQIIRNPSFDKNEHLWYPNLGGGMSFLNEPVFKKKYDDDLSSAILDPDAAKEQAIFQVNSEQTLAISNLLRAFDDTVANDNSPRDKRTVTEWWQQMETDANKVFTAPVVRLFLPATWAVGVDPLDPLFAGARPESDAEKKRDPRSKSIEVQLRASDDLLGQVAGYVERSTLLKLEQEIIPVVVPLGSPTEYRALAQAWETWKKERIGPDGKGTYPPEVDSLIAKLEEYAVRIEEVRTIRSELARYIGDVLSRQRDISKTIADWIERNLQKYKDFLEAKKERFTLQKVWKDTQQLMIDFHDKTNEPWCKNDRFTTSIYSLLDPWLPGRPGLTGGNTTSCEPDDGLPKICPPTGEKDLVFDLSTLQVGTGAFTIPVLQPTQIKLILPTPGPIDKDPPNLTTLVPPDLPPIPPSIVPEALKNLPTVTVSGSPRDIDVPPQPDLTQPKKALEEAQGVIREMIKTYQEFWDSIATPHPDRGCPGLGAMPCVHVEMDLIERFTRIGARPMVLLKEDFDSVGKPRTLVQPKDKYDCKPDDHACLDLLPEKEFGREGWQVLFPQGRENEQKKHIEKLRTMMRDHTLSKDATEVKGKVPYQVPVEEIYGPFTVPDPVEIKPFRPSSSSSSASP
jgi:hypothetical protein